VNSNSRYAFSNLILSDFALVSFSSNAARYPAMKLMTGYKLIRKLTARSPEKRRAPRETIGGTIIVCYAFASGDFAGSCVNLLTSSATVIAIYKTPATPSSAASIRASPLSGTTSP
jgi:hypothetical protein